MKTVSVQQFCVHYDIPQEFIDSLSNFELIELIEKESNKYILIDDINRVERLMRMHYDLNVNFEGLDIINNLLQQITNLQNDIELLKNDIHFYK